MKTIADYAYSTGARTLKRLQTWALISVVALAGLLGAGQALAASSPPFVELQNPTTLFAATYDGGVFKGSLSAGSWSWAACGTGLPGSTRLRSLIVDSTGNLYAGSETGVFKNTAACGAWTAQNTGMP